MVRTREEVVREIERARNSLGSAARINLTGWNLESVNLSGLNLSGARLCGAKLCFANLSGSYLKQIGLSGADLSGANLSAADLHQARLIGANLEEVNFNYTNLYKADLSDVVSFHRAEFDHTILIDARLGRADLRQTNVSDAVFRLADLSYELRSFIMGRPQPNVPLIVGDSYTTFQAAQFPDGFSPRFRSIRGFESLAAMPLRESLEKLSMFSAVDVNTVFPLPRFFAGLSEEQQAEFIKKRELITCCGISHDEIITPVTIGKEKQHYDCKYFALRHLKCNTTLY
ncbi:pentapeptide repeat-containing protein [Piscirickettsia salmonis]|uniref:pentapeptide repeat-containing protein n=1 Tax=Piscirickettsia salmonis TaxID=1238 RepID=UPI00069048E5|nr:pentapeptide repeat-containing protein [Piscirickettsia salmonis]